MHLNLQLSQQTEYLQPNFDPYHKTTYLWGSKRPFIYGLTIGSNYNIARYGNQTLFPWNPNRPPPQIPTFSDWWKSAWIDDQPLHRNLNYRKEAEDALRDEPQPFDEKMSTILQTIHKNRNTSDNLLEQVLFDIESNCSRFFSANVLIFFYKRSYLFFLIDNPENILKMEIEDMMSPENKDNHNQFDLETILKSQVDEFLSEDHKEFIFENLNDPEPILNMKVEDLIDQDAKDLLSENINDPENILKMEVENLISQESKDFITNNTKNPERILKIEVEDLMDQEIKDSLFENRQKSQRISKMESEDLMDQEIKDSKNTNNASDVD